MDIKNRKMFEAFLIGLRDEIIQTRICKTKDCRTRSKRVSRCADKRYIPIDLGLLDENDREKVNAIDKALLRLQLNIYNICECCNRTLSERQLSETALPWPTKCRKCEAEGQKKKNIKQPYPDSPAVNVMCHQV